MNWLRTDVAKIVGACLSAAAGVLLATYPPPNTIGTVASIVIAVCAGLGIASGGTSGNQPPPKPTT